MTKARDLADLISAGNPLADGAISVSEISDLTATATELNYSDITTLGTVEASKVVTADANGNVTFPDDEVLQFGASGDLRLFHNGSASYISDQGTGNLVLQASDALIVQNGAGTENLLTAYENGAVSLYYDNTKVFETNSDGIAINKENPEIQLHDTGSGGTIWRISNGSDGNGKLTFNDNDVERLSIQNDGRVAIGAPNYSVFNGVGGNSQLLVKGSDTNTTITNNTNASITIANDDGTANNLAGLHFARADTDDNPHYAGASVVAQFVETQVTGQYPKAELSFLTSTAANTAPSEKMRIEANGVVYTLNNTHQGYSALSGTTPTVDADTAGSFALTTSGNTTFTFSSVTSGRTVGFVLKLTAGGTHTITWPSSIDWAGATAPDAPASGETDVLVFYTVDGGTNWYGALAIDAAG